jgi:hypothetical protein
MCRLNLVDGLAHGASEVVIMALRGRPGWSWDTFHELDSFAPPTSLPPTAFIKSPSTKWAYAHLLDEFERSRFGHARTASTSVHTASSSTLHGHQPQAYDRRRPWHGRYWQTVRPTHRHGRSATTVKSLRWPEVKQGSLLIRLSSCNAWIGYSLQEMPHCQRHSIDMAPGVPVTA